jgi:PIN domain nuclease of toxin-antitoxin system
MIYLIDTHILIWLSMKTSRLDAATREILENPGNEVYFSAISIFEIAIKQQLARSDFLVEATGVRRAMLRERFMELTVDGLHAAFVATLPPIHKDPFDRLLVAQANVEGITLITADEQIARYPGPILKI